MVKRGNKYTNEDRYIRSSLSRYSTEGTSSRMVMTGEDVMMIRQRSSGVSSLSSPSSADTRRTNTSSATPPPRRRRMLWNQQNELHEEYHDSAGSSVSTAESPYRLSSYLPKTHATRTNCCDDVSENDTTSDGPSDEESRPSSLFAGTSERRQQDRRQQLRKTFLAADSLSNPTTTSSSSTTTRHQLHLLGSNQFDIPEDDPKVESTLDFADTKDEFLYWKEGVEEGEDVFNDIIPVKPLDARSSSLLSEEGLSLTSTRTRESNRDDSSSNREQRRRQLIAQYISDHHDDDEKEMIMEPSLEIERQSSHIVQNFDQCKTKHQATTTKSIAKPSIPDKNVNEEVDRQKEHGDDFIDMNVEDTAGVATGATKTQKRRPCLAMPKAWRRRVTQLACINPLRDADSKEPHKDDNGNDDDEDAYDYEYYFTIGDNHSKRHSVEPSSDSPVVHTNTTTSQPKKRNERWNSPSDEPKGDNDEPDDKHRSSPQANAVPATKDNIRSNGCSAPKTSNSSESSSEASPQALDPLEGWNCMECPTTTRGREEDPHITLTCFGELPQDQQQQQQDDLSLQEPDNLCLANLEDLKFYCKTCTITPETTCHCGQVQSLCNEGCHDLVDHRSSTCGQDSKHQSTNQDNNYLSRIFPTASEAIPAWQELLPSDMLHMVWESCQIPRATTTSLYRNSEASKKERETVNIRNEFQY